MRLLRWILLASVAVVSTAGPASATASALPRTGLADTLLIVTGGTMVALALVASIIMWRKRG